MCHPTVCACSLRLPAGHVSPQHPALTSSQPSSPKSPKGELVRSPSLPPRACWFRTSHSMSPCLHFITYNLEIIKPSALGLVRMQ